MATDEATSTVGGQSGGPAPAGPELVRAIPARHPGRWIATVVVLFVAAWLLYGAITDANF